MFAKHHVFTVENGQLVPVKYPDPQKLSELPGYEQEREKVIANTRALLTGMPANNVLLYGARAGSGRGRRRAEGRGAACARSEEHTSELQSR